MLKSRRLSLSPLLTPVSLSSLHSSCPTSSRAFFVHSFGKGRGFLCASAGRMASFAQVHGSTQHSSTRVVREVRQIGVSNHTGYTQQINGSIQLAPVTTAKLHQLRVSNSPSPPRIVLNGHSTLASQRDESRREEESLLGTTAGSFRRVPLRSPESARYASAEQSPDSTLSQPHNSPPPPSRHKLTHNHCYYDAAKFSKAARHQRKIGFRFNSSTPIFFIGLNEP